MALREFCWSMANLSHHKAGTEGVRGTERVSACVRAGGRAGVRAGWRAGVGVCVCVCVGTLYPRVDQILS